MEDIAVHSGLHCVHEEGEEHAPQQAVQEEGASPRLVPAMA